MASPDTAKLCVECKSEIHPGAGLCPVCKTYQRKLRRNIQYFATVIGVITALAGVFVYIISTLPTVRRFLWWRDKIEVVEFYSNVGVAIANSGDGDAYVSRVSVALPDVPPGLPDVRLVGKSFEVGVTVPSGSVIQRKFSGERLEFIHNTTKDDWLTLARQATSTSQDSCFLLIYFSVNHPALQQMQSAYGDGFHTVAAAGAIFYYSPQGREWLTQNFSARAAIARRSDKCGS